MRYSPSLGTKARDSIRLFRKKPAQPLTATIGLLVKTVHDEINKDDN